MIKPSGRHIFLFICAVLILLCPLLLYAADIKTPDYIGRANNPYILPDENGPGFFLCAAIGLITGMLNAVIGAGGGLLVVPALMAAGVSGIYAVGSELFRLFIFSTIESIRMGLNRRIRYTLALVMGLGTTVGGLAGYQLTKTIFIADPAGSDVFITFFTVLWLTVYAFIIIPDFRDAARAYALEMLRKEKAQNEEREAINTEERKESSAGASDPKGKKEEDTPKKTEPEPRAEFEDDLYPDEEPWEISGSLRAMKLPPYIKFPSAIKDEEDELEPAELDRDGEGPDIEKEKDNSDRISFAPILLTATVGGFLIVLTGSGGVILTFTLMSKGFGCVAALVAGTDLARLAISSGALTMSTFGVDGFINIYCISGLIFGTVSGLHLGSKGLKHILPYRVKGLVSLLVVSVMINRLLALPELLRRAGASIDHGFTSALESSGNYILLIGAGIFGGWVLYAFINSIRVSLQPPTRKGENK